MSQEDMNCANQNGAAFRADLNNQLEALVTNSSGSSAPSTTFAYQWWADTTNGLLKQRNAANTGWITIGTLASTYLGAEQSANKDVSGGYAGLTGQALNIWNAAKSYMAKLVTTATGNWTHTLPNRTGTLLDDTDYTALTSGYANDSTARTALSGSANDSTARTTADSALSLAEGANKYQAFTSSGTWTKPSWVDPSCLVLIECWGGGGGGSTTTTDGGGGGGYSSAVFLASQLGATETVTVGAGGTKAAGNGGNGGNSSFGSWIQAGGGGGGQSGSGGGAGGGYAGADHVTAGAAGTPISKIALYNFPTDAGADGGGSSGSATPSTVVNTSGGGSGGRASYGYGTGSYYGGGGGTSDGPSTGGYSRYGGGGGGVNVDGTAPGGGGGQNGSGARGEVRVRIL